MITETGKESKDELMLVRAGANKQIEDWTKTYFPAELTVGFIHPNYTNCFGVNSRSDQVAFGKGFFEFNFGYRILSGKSNRECIPKDRFEEIIRDPRAAFDKVVEWAKDYVPNHLEEFKENHAKDISKAEKYVPEKKKAAQERRRKKQEEKESEKEQSMEESYEEEHK